MAEIRIKVEGLDKLTSLASKFPKITQKNIDEAIVRSIGQIDIETKPITPVKTARLRNSMIPVFTPFRGVYGSDLPYASSVHDLYPAGTPYRFPSLNKNALSGFLSVGVRRAENTIKKVMSSALDKIVAELAR